MKHTIISIIAATLMVACGIELVARASHEELVANSKQSIRDWETVLTVLKKAGYADDSSYKRVTTALKKSETRLANLEKVGSKGEYAKARSALASLGLVGAAKARAASTTSRRTHETTKAKTHSSAAAKKSTKKAADKKKLVQKKRA